MSSQNRIFGQNLCYFLKRNQCTYKQLADLLGYSEEDIQRIIDARLYISIDEKERIASAIGVTVEDLTVDHSGLSFGELGYMECRGEFSSRESLNEILDRFDAYCDIQELLAE